MAVLVETDALLKVIAAAFAAGVGVTVLFSIVVFAATRAVELRREGAVAAPVLLAVVAVAALAACLLAVAFGLRVMTAK